jgi:hypothetical protein
MLEAWHISIAENNPAILEGVMHNLREARIRR